MNAHYARTRARAIAHPLAADDPRHGTSGGYTNWRCRCDACRSAFTIAHQRYMDSHPEQRLRATLRQLKRSRATGHRPVQHTELARRLSDPAYRLPWTATRVGGAWRLFYAVLLTSKEEFEYGGAV